MKSKHTVIILVTALVVTNGYWIYQIFDSSVTLMYVEASVESMAMDRQQTVVLANLNVVGRSVDDVIELLGTDINGHRPFEKEGCLFYSQVCLQLNDQRVVVAVGTAND